MRERADGSAEREGGILAVLAGDAALDAPTLEALRGLDPGLRTARGTDEALAALREGAVGLVVLDAAAPSADPVGLLEAVGESGEGGRPMLLTILAPGTREAPDLPHYLARPFRAETLGALVRMLLERGPGRSLEEDTPPSIQVRQPSRFSARPLYGEAVAYVRESFERARETGAAPEVEGARLVAERIHTSLLQSNLLLLRALEPYEVFELPNHCTNVAVFSAKIAMGLDLSLSEALRVIQAGLLHDIGMMLLPERILRKEGPLSTAEREEMQRHPTLGADILAALGPDYEWLRRAVSQEHERFGGQGYPEGLASDQIDPIAHILGVADVFEAYSQTRAYRSPFGSFEALKKVTSLRGELFAPEVVDSLAGQISVFPLDSYVLLSTGEIGRVVEINPENLMRPAVEVLWSDDWSPLEKPRRMELGKESGLSVVRPLHEAEVPIT